MHDFLCFCRSLKELDLGLKGELTITPDMEDLGNSLFFDQVNTTDNPPDDKQTLNHNFHLCPKGASCLDQESLRFNARPFQLVQRSHHEDQGIQINFKLT